MRSRLVFAKAWGGRVENEKGLLMSVGLLFGGDENVLELDSGNSCTILEIH